MNIERKYSNTRFSAIIISDALNAFESIVDSDTNISTDFLYKVTKGSDTIRYDNREEFLSDIKDCNSYRLELSTYYPEKSSTLFWITFSTNTTYVDVQLEKREDIFKILEFFERTSAESKLPDPEPTEEITPTIFIGHGRSTQWRDLKDHLVDKHSYNVEAFEVGARAGHAIRDILDSMLTNSSLALIVMTGEDETADGKLNPRLNVVHEAGLFQGSLGFDKAIILLEDGTEEFSNIHGIQQIRFNKDNIKETFGDVIAVIKREFHI